MASFFPPDAKQIHKIVSMRLNVVGCVQGVFVAFTLVIMADNKSSENSTGDIYSKRSEAFIV